MSTGYIKSLDGIRAMALLLIMTYHAQLTHFTWVSVQLFFVLSGYLITGILWKEKYKQEESLGFRFKKFWVRRSLRIFPLYFGYIGLLGVTYLLFNFPTYYEKYFPYLVSYTVNYTRLMPGWEGNPLFTHLWTLSIEEQFYLIFPLIIFFLPAKWIKRLLIFIIFASPVVRYALGEYFKAKGGIDPAIIADTVYWNTLTHLDSFCMGGIIPILALEKKITKPHWIFTSSILIFIAAGVLNYFTSSTTLGFFDDFGYNHWLIDNYQHVWHYTLINFVCASLILILVSQHGREHFTIIRKILENRVIVRIGKVSYGMYVFHWIVLTYIFNRLFPTDNMLLKVLLYFPYVATVYALAELSYNLFESRFLKMKDTFFTKKKKKEKEVAADQSLPPLAQEKS